MVLEIISVYFRRNKRLILDNFNLKLRKSQIIILIGDNGVGKSSLLDISVGILKPEKGTVKINKIPLEELESDKKKKFTYIPHKDSLKDYLTVEENLVSWLSISENKISKKEFYESLKFFNLHKISQNPISNLSHGQRKKVSLTKLLLSKSKLWLLDEPFNGLDTSSINKCKILIYDHIKNDGSIILSSHIDIKLKGSKKIFIKKPEKNFKQRNINLSSWDDIR